MHTSTNTTCTDICIWGTGAQWLPFCISPSVKSFTSYPLSFKTLCLPCKHTDTHKSNAMPLNRGDLDLGHQLYNECLQRRDKWCLTCFHLLWCWYTDFPRKPNRAFSLSDLVGRSNGQNQQCKGKKTKTRQIVLSWMTFIFLWILEVWTLLLCCHKWNIYKNVNLNKFYSMGEVFQI